MMEFNHFYMDVLIFIMFIILVIGIQVVEHYWPPPEVGWHPIGRIKYIYIYPIEGGYRKEVEQVDCTKDCGLSFSDNCNHYVWKDRKYLIYTKEREDNSLEVNETLEKDQTPKEHENSEGQRQEEDGNPKQSQELELIDLHNPNFITLQPNVLQDVQLIEDVRTVKYPDGTITYIRDCGNKMAYNLSKMCGNAKDTFNRLGSQNKYVRSLLFKSRKPNKIEGEIESYNYLNPEFSMCSLVNEESVKEIKLMSENDDFSHVNFRPNFVIEATPKYCEDQIESLKIGSVKFNNVLPCAVGEYVNIDPEAGNVYSRNLPYSTLLEKRKLKDVRSDISTVSDIPVFGITLDILSTEGKIHIGDQVFAKFRRSQ